MADAISIPRQVLHHEALPHLAHPRDAVPDLIARGDTRAHA